MRMGLLLMIPLDGEASDRAQQVGLRAEAMKVLDCLGDEQIRLLSGALHPEQRNEGFLARSLVLPHALARLLLLALDIEDVVGDLESKANITGIAAQGTPSFSGEPAHDPPGFKAEADKGPGLELLQPSDRGDIQRHFLGGEIHHLPARHS